MTVAREGQKQHVELHRKVGLRRHLCQWATNGAAYVPFIGDGDIASQLYTDRPVFGADLDEQRVEVARDQLAPNKGGEIIVADCDEYPLPFSRDPGQVAIADFDAYVDPYTGFRAFWSVGSYAHADPVVVIFTDGRRQGMMRTGVWYDFDGVKHQLEGLAKARMFHAYYSRHALPWLTEHVGPAWRIRHAARYLRGWMIYWGAVIERA